jgi:hypothetical protein
MFITKIASELSEYQRGLSQVVKGRIAIELFLGIFCGLLDPWLSFSSNFLLYLIFARTPSFEL